MNKPASTPNIVIACGGTGGHLFPGIAVARAMLRRGVRVRLIVSEKEVDRHAASGLKEMEVLTVPAVGFSRAKPLSFFRGFAASSLKCVSWFRKLRPDIVLAMGGFTSAPPLVVGRSFGAATFLHESNSIPGKANRLLSNFVLESFIGFSSARSGLRSRKVTITGTPVRAEFVGLDQARSRATLCLDTRRPVVLVMGGSQGAGGINQLVASGIVQLAKALPSCQWLHIAGSGNVQTTKTAYGNAGIRAEVFGFMARMDLALGAATVAVSRAGASSLAELAAAKLPSVLIPFPAAAGNHQFFNAKAYADAGAAVLLEQKSATPSSLASLLGGIVNDAAYRQRIQTSLRGWHTPNAADSIAEAMLKAGGLDAHCIGVNGRNVDKLQDPGSEFLPCERLEVSEEAPCRKEVPA